MSSLKNHKRIHFIVPYPFDIAPGQRFRYEQYLSLLKENGYHLSIFPFLSVATNNILYKKGNFGKKTIGVLAGFIRRILYLPLHLQADFIFIFREATPLGPPFIEWILAKVFRKKIIYDFDDAIWLPNTSNENKIISWLKWHSKVKSICRWSYKVSCGNEYLCAFAKSYSSSVVLNPTTIETDDLHNPLKNKSKLEKSQSEKITIGWTGSHSTIKYLSLVEKVIQRLEKKISNLEFIVIADTKPLLNISSLHFIPWSKENEVESLLKIDIGIMPLTDDLWAKGKCGFKALQYMALQIPVVASPVGINNKIIDPGINGFFASSEQEWIISLTKLLQDAQLRYTMGKQGREKILKGYSVNSNTQNFLRLFSSY